MVINGLTNCKSISSPANIKQKRLRLESFHAVLSQKFLWRSSIDLHNIFWGTLSHLSQCSYFIPPWKHQKACHFLLKGHKIGKIATLMIKWVEVLLKTTKTQFFFWRQIIHENLGKNGLVHFMAIFHFYTPQKTSSFDVFRWCRNGIFAWNVLNFA